ncbi:hypothetical protein AB0425_26555 [Actinosynnema sp. NPDC051121]
MRRTFGAALALVSMIAAVPASAVGPGYVELATLPGGTKGSAVAINDAGVVVGRSTGADGPAKPVRWDPDGRITELLPPAGASPGKVFGVDADGAAYGNTSTADRWAQATRWNPDGSATVLDVPPGDTYSFAVAVNERGTVVGYSGDPNGNRHAIRWDRDGSATVLPGLAKATEATAVDAAGAIAGIATTPDDLAHYVRWDDGVLTDLGVVPGATYSSVAAVNGRYVVGRIQRGDRTGYGVRWDGPTSAEVPTRPDLFSVLLAVDADGTAFGQADGKPVRWTADGTVTVMPLPEGYNAGEVTLLSTTGIAAGTAISRYNRPVRWSPSGEVTLLPVPSGTYGFAQGVNARGVVVGEYGGRPLLWP